MMGLVDACGGESSCMVNGGDCFFCFFLLFILHPFCVYSEIDARTGTAVCPS